VKRIAIAVVLLAAIFVASTAKAQVVDGPLDHFACYTVRPLKGTPRFEPIPGVTLRDQFERVTFEVRRPLDICNPARKNDEPVSDAETHLKAYQVKPVRNSEKPIERESLVKDQFHRSGLRVITKRAQILLVPTSKNLGDVVPPPLDPATHAVDHFACYRAKPPKGEKFEKITGVKVEDQFLQSKRYDLLPRWLCNPADKLWLGKVELKKMPQKHLLCYVARRVKGEPKHISRRVAVNNQFGPELLNTIREDMLCIPATKELIDPPPYCGDGVVNTFFEQCDPPGSLCAGGFGVCSTSCKCNETDIFPATVARVEIEFSPGQTETIDLQGPTTVDVQLGGIGDRDNNGREEVETEMLELRLTGMSRILGPVQVQLNPTMPSRGTIEERVNNTVATLDLPPLAPAGAADSFFDVFFEIEVSHIPGMVLHNNDPKRMATTITRKPPATGETYEDPTPIKFYNSNGQPTGIRMLGARHVPTPAPPVCNNGVWDLGEVCDLSANVWWCWTPSGLESTCLSDCTCFISVIGTGN